MENKNKLEAKIIGIDIGGVILKLTPKSDTSEDTIFNENYLESKANEGCFDSVKKIVDKYGAENCFIVSKASARI
jgi:uncharacterized hydantoinase/oxoprolinase family protein